MNWYLKNLLCGFKFCTFINCEPKEFTITWHALFAVIATIIGSHALIDAIATGRNAVYNTGGWYFFHACLFAATFIGVYIAAAITKRLTNLLEIWVIFYNSYLFILLPYFTLSATNPNWLSNNLAATLDSLIAIWTFLIGFRIIFQSIAPQPVIGVMAALAISSSIYVFNEKIYVYSFFYNSANEQEEDYFDFSAEELFAMQQQLLEENMENFTPSKRGEVDIYGISLGLYSHQDVFMRESKYVSQRMEEILGMSNGIMTLINNKSINDNTPLANITNLKRVLHRLKNIMQPEEDIVMIYLTGHGSQKSGLSVNLDYRYTMNNITPKRLSETIKNSGIENKIIFISACHSGVFIPNLKDENSLIITAAADNKQSYGCSDDAELTHFADAYFKQALEETTDIVKAFQISKSLIEKREKEDGVEEPSNPQIFIGDNITHILKQYKKVELISTEETNSK